VLSDFLLKICIVVRNSNAEEFLKNGTDTSLVDMGQKVVQVLSTFTEDVLNELLLLAFAEAQHKLLEVATEDVI
jgi:hypothetical protein